MASNCAFASILHLNDHFLKHGADFGASSTAEYEAWACGFMVGPKSANVLEAVRKGGDLVRFDPSTQEFGVVNGGVIRTYYRPVPCSSVAALFRAAARSARKCHDRVDNMQYFLAEAAK